ncbi:MAG: hypothetical protein KDA80_24750, partial [Planctomycetaceae bacterium]|nr:hypothetical protein [Planctomycetaceae bacterium]
MSVVEDDLLTTAPPTEDFEVSVGQAVPDGDLSEFNLPIDSDDADEDSELSSDFSTPKKVIPPRRQFSIAARRRLINLGLLLVVSAIVIRLLHVQWLSRETFTGKAFRQQVSEEPIVARPGDLVDRQGRLLATTISVPSLYVDPSRMETPEESARSIATALDIDPDTLAERIQRNAKRQFLWVKRHLSDVEATSIRELQLPKHWAGLRREFQRHYPQGPLAAHVLGLRDIDGKGRGGAEQAF